MAILCNTFDVPVSWAQHLYEEFPPGDIVLPLKKLLILAHLNSKGFYLFT